MGVVGSISIKDNVTAVLRGIRAEQSSFKQSVADTKKELKSTWEKQYKARLDATPAAKKITELRGKLAPLSKKLAIAIAVKDLAMEGLKRIGSKVKEVLHQSTKSSTPSTTASFCFPGILPYPITSSRLRSAF